MANIDRYVDPTVVGGAGDGTSWADAFDSLTDLIGDDPGGAGDDIFVHCRGGVDNMSRFQINFDIAADSWTISIEDNLYYIDFDDPYDEGIDFSGSFASAATFNGAYPVRIVNTTSANSASTVAYWASSGATVDFDTGLIIENPSALPAATYPLYMRGSGTITINNLIIYQDTDRTGVRSADNGLTATINGGTIIGGTGVSAADATDFYNSGTTTYNGVYIGGGWNLCFDSGVTQSECASEDTSATGTDFDSITFNTTNFEDTTFPGVASILDDDFAVPLSASGLKNAATISPSNDAYGTSRSPNNSIGAIVGPVANLVRYVNTASTAGGDGTTNATSGASRAYPTIANFDSNEATNLQQQGDTITARCSGSTDDTTAATLGTDWITDADHFVTITANTDSDAAGPLLDTGRYLLKPDADFGACLEIQCSVLVERIQVDGSLSASGTSIRMQNSVSTDDVTLDRLHVVSAPSWEGVRIEGDNFDIVRVQNCLIRGDGTGTGLSNAYLDGGSGSRDIVFAHNTVVDHATGINNGGNTSGTDTWNNNLSDLNTTDYSGSADTTNNNISGDATSPDVSFRNTAVTFDDAANDDYRTTDSDVVDQGFNYLPGVPALDGNTRGTSPDIGAFESVDGGASTTGTITGTGTVTGSGEKDAEVSTSSTGTGSVTATGEKEVGQTGTATGVGTVTAGGQKEGEATGSATATGTVTATATAEEAASTTGAIAGTGSVTATGRKEGEATGAASATDSVIASAQKEGEGTGTATGTDSVTGSVEKQGEASGTTTAAGSLSATVSASGDQSTTGAIAVTGTVTASVEKQVDRTGSIVGLESVIAAVEGERVSDGSISETGSLTATASALEQGEAVGTINGAGTVSASVEKSALVSSQTSATDSVTSASQKEASAAANLAGSGLASSIVLGDHVSTGAIAETASLTATAFLGAAGSAVAQIGMTALYDRDVDLTARLRQ